MITDDYVAENQEAIQKLIELYAKGNNFFCEAENSTALMKRLIDEEFIELDEHPWYWVINPESKKREQYENTVIISAGVVAYRVDDQILQKQKTLT